MVSAFNEEYFWAMKISGNFKNFFIYHKIRFISFIFIQFQSIECRLCQSIIISTCDQYINTCSFVYYTAQATIFKKAWEVSFIDIAYLPRLSSVIEEKELAFSKQKILTLLIKFPLFLQLCLQLILLLNRLHLLCWKLNHFTFSKSFLFILYFRFLSLQFILIIKWKH